MMLQWRVHDVMTRDVVTLPEDASSADVAAVLTERRVSGVPIIDRYDTVVGVVTWTDILRGFDFDAQERGQRQNRHLTWRRADDAAVDVMTAAPVTIAPDASLATAARTMHRRNLSRLLVVDSRHRLLGIVTRRDLLQPFSRMDSVAEDDVKQRVLRRMPMIEPGSVQVRVDDGVATLTGRTTNRSTALAVAGLTEAVPGIAGIVDALSYDTDDTVPAPPTRIDPPDPIRGWLGSSAASSAEDTTPPVFAHP
jgi:CBS domain-containing protein